MKTPLLNSNKIHFQRFSINLIIITTLTACGGGGNSTEAVSEVATQAEVEAQDNTTVQPEVSLQETIAPENFLFQARDNLDFMVEATHGNGNVASFIGVSVFLGVEEAEYPEYGSGVGKNLVWSGATDESGKVSFNLIIGQAQPYVYITSDVMGKSNSQWVDLTQTNTIQL